MYTDPSVVKKTKVLIVDDHPAVCEALSLRISQQADMEVTGEADDAAHALKLMSETRPDIIVTDITLKKSDGIDLIKRIKAREPQARILVWSMPSERVYAERAMRAGAMGYITKEQATEKIIDAIRQVMTGKLYLSMEMREVLLSRVVDGRQAQGRSMVNELTDRELEVFRLIGSGVRTQEIADQLHLSIKTVETHRDRIKKKLDLKDATELIRYEIGRASC